MPLLEFSLETNLLNQVVLLDGICGSTLTAEYTSKLVHTRLVYVVRKSFNYSQTQVSFHFLLTRLTYSLAKKAGGAGRQTCTNAALVNHVMLRSVEVIHINKVPLLNSDRCSRMILKMINVHSNWVYRANMSM